MATYAAMVERMDRNIGRLLESLRESGQADNTLVLFLSDNGTDPFSSVDAPLLKQGKLPGDRSSNFQPGVGWAYACCTPWRLYKISQHGGGITTGAVAWWASAKAEKGSIDPRPLHMVDILPTFLEAAGVKPAEPVPGQSFLSALRGEPSKHTNPHFYQYMDNRAIRTADWTLAEVDGNGWELFDTKADVLETQDLAATKPELVKTLSEQWLAWWKTEGEKESYIPKSTKTGPHYKPQGDRGSGEIYVPSAMPERLADRLPVKH
jgi:arylsulfatase